MYEYLNFNIYLTTNGNISTMTLLFFYYLEYAYDPKEPSSALCNFLLLNISKYCSLAIKYIRHMCIFFIMPSYYEIDCNVFFDEKNVICIIVP